MPKPMRLHALLAVFALLISPPTIPCVFGQGVSARLFRLEQTITFDSSVTLNDITALLVDSTGRMVVVDRIGQAAYLFSPHGSLIKRLSVEKCSPGMEFRPISAIGCSDGTFCLVGGGFKGSFRFTKDGNCLDGLDSLFFPTNRMCADQGGNIYSLYSEEALGPIRKCDPTGLELKRFGRIPRDYVGLIERVDGGGIACDDDGYIYVCFSTSNEILRYDPSLEKVGSYKRTTPLYQQPEALPNRVRLDKATIYSTVTSKIKGKSLVLSLNVISRGKLLIQFTSGSQVGIQLFDVNGQYYPQWNVTIPAPFLAFQSGRAYMVRQGDPYPSVEVYKYE